MSAASRIEYPLQGKRAIPCKRCGQPIAWHHRRKGGWVPLDVRAAKDVSGDRSVARRHQCWSGSGALQRELTP